MLVLSGSNSSAVASMKSQLNHTGATLKAIAAGIEQQDVWLFALYAAVFLLSELQRLLNPPSQRLLNPAPNVRTAVSSQFHQSHLFLSLKTKFNSFFSPLICQM